VTYFALIFDLRLQGTIAISNTQVLTNLQWECVLDSFLTAILLETTPNSCVLEGRPYKF
jgi:hypothetical protein